MTVVTTRPSSSSNSGASVTGAASVHAALQSPDSDSSYVEIGDGDYFIATCSDPTIPSGGVVKSVALRLRGLQAYAAGNVTFTIYAGATYPAATSSGNVFWPVPVTWTALSTSASGTVTPTAKVQCLGPPIRTLRFHELYFDTTYVAKPTLTVDLPTGTVTTTNRPTVSWTGTFDSDGSTQISYRVKVFNSTQYGAGGFDPATSTPVWDSGEVVSTDTSVVAGTNLPNATYRAYVQLGALVNLSTGITSDWTYGGFTVSVTAPSTPSQTLTSHVSSGYVEVDVVYGGGTTTSGLEVDRQDVDGNWQQITSGTGGTIADYYDYLPPQGTAYYRARAYRDMGSNSYIYSDYDSDSLAYNPTVWWLKHPDDESLNKQLRVKSFQTVDKPARQGTFQALGAERAVTVSDTRGAEMGTLEVWCDSDDERDAIYALIETGDPLFLQPKYDEHERDRWVSIGDVSAERAIDQGWSQRFVLTLPWTEVETPN